MKLSRTVEYALQATLQLAQSTTGAPVPSSQLAAAGAMPERFLLQVLRSLVNRGILNSTRGVVGGYALGRSAKEISLLDLVEAIEGPMSAYLPDPQSLPPAAFATLRNRLERAVNALRTELEALKLSDLLPKPDDNEPPAS